jgi:GT2 family glycosyltransferase
MLLAVLVLYKERLEESATFSSLFGASHSFNERLRLLVYDNSPAPMHAVEEPRFEGGRVAYISDISNPGVSKAYNAGAQWARRLGCSHMLLLDQDTIFPQDAILAYINAIENNFDCALFAPLLVSGGRIYSPCRSVLNVNLPLRAIDAGRTSTRGVSVLNSGMCVAVDAFEKIGGFDEAIPLDFADHDFFKRYRRHFDSFLLLDVRCEHGFSDRETQDLDKALARFRFYCRGARNAIKGLADVVPLPALAFVRAARLSLRFGSPAFLHAFFRIFFRG